MAPRLKETDDEYIVANEVDKSKKLARSSAHDSFDIELMESAARQSARHPRVLSAEERHRVGAMRAARAERAAERVLREAHSIAESLTTDEVSRDDDVLRRFKELRGEESERRRQAEAAFRDAEQQAADAARALAAEIAREDRVAREVDRELEEALEAADAEEYKATSAEAALRALDRPRHIHQQALERPMPSKQPTIKQEAPASPARAAHKSEMAKLRAVQAEQKRANRIKQLAEVQRRAREQRQAKILEIERERERRVEIARERLRRDRIEATVRAAMRKREKEAAEQRRTLDHAVDTAQTCASSAAAAAMAAGNCAQLAATRAANAANKFKLAREKRDRLLAQRAVAAALDAHAAKVADSAAAALTAAAAIAAMPLAVALAFQDAVFQIKMPRTWASKPARKLLDNFIKAYENTKGPLGPTKLALTT